MRLLVQIGEDEQIYEFEQRSIIVGSTDSCDIVLRYEGIGARHLKIFEQNHETYIGDLKSGFPTYMNDKQMVPGKRYEYSSFFPVELGGIIISLMDDVAPVVEEIPLEASPPQTPVPTPSKTPQNTTAETPPEFTSSFQDPDAIQPADEAMIGSQAAGTEDETKILQNIKEQVENPDREQFKPDIYGGEEGTGQFKIKNVNIAEAKKARASSNLTGTKKIKRKKRKRTIKQVDVKSNKQRFSLGTVFGVGVLLLVSAFIFYKKHYQKLVVKNTSPTRVQLKIKKYRIIDSGYKIIDRRKSDFEYWANTGGCSEKLTKVCDILRSTVFQEFEGVFEKNGELNIFISNGILTSLASRTLAYLPADDNLIQQVVEEQYGADFSYDAFVTNNKKALNEDYIRSARDYERIILMLNIILQDDFFTYFKNTKFKQVNFYSYKVEDKRLLMNSYLGVNRQALEFHAVNYSELSFKFKLIFNSYLAKGINEMVASIGETHLNEYDPTQINLYTMQTALAGYSKILEQQKCVAEKEIPYCEGFLKNYARDAREGVLISGNKLFFVVDSVKLEGSVKEPYLESYDKETYRFMLGQYRKVNRVRGLEFESFRNNTYVETRLTNQEYNQNKLMAVFFDTDVLTKFQDDQELTEIVLMAYHENNVHTVIIFPKDNLKGVASGAFSKHIKVFWKSVLDTFTNFIDRKASKVISI